MALNLQNNYIEMPMQRQSCKELYISKKLIKRYGDDLYIAVSLNGVYQGFVKKKILPNKTSKYKSEGSF